MVASIRSTVDLHRKAFFAACLAAFGVVACALSLCVAFGAAPAYADDALKVSGADHYGTVDQDASIDILSVSGPSGEEIFVDMWHGRKAPQNYVARHNPYSLEAGSGDSAANGVSIVSMKLEGLDTKYLDPDSTERYNIEVYADPNAETLLYKGTLYGVYAKLVNADGSSETRLLGTRMLADGETREYQPPATYYLNDSDGNGVPYSLDSTTVDEQQGCLTYTYSPNGESDLTGSITYVDLDGKVLCTRTVSGVSDGHDVEVDVPSVIKAKDPDSPDVENYYRTISPSDKVTLSYPNQLNYTVRCKSMGDVLDPELAGTYIAKINYVANGSSTPVMTDRVKVSGKMYYTVPDSFFQRTGGDQGAVVTYTLAADQDNVLVLDAADPAIEASLSEEDGRELSYTVNYMASEPGSTINWTIVKVAAAQSAAQRSGDAYTPVTFAKESTPVAPGATATYQAEAETVDGQTYVPYGKTSYSFTNDGRTDPVTYIYYVPDGYTPEDAYQITVQYMNIADGSVLDSYTIDVDPNMLEDIIIEPGPERLTVNGSTYVRLAGQDVAFEHGYFTPYRTYTIYYRDINDTANANTVITRTMIVDTIVDGGTQPTVGFAAGDALAAAGQEGAQDGGLLLNEEGVDTQTEREIEDEANPLAGPDASHGIGLFGSPAATGVALGAGLLLIAAIVLFFRIRSNRNDDKLRGQVR